MRKLTFTLDVRDNMPDDVFKNWQKVAAQSALFVGGNGCQGGNPEHTVFVLLIDTRVNPDIPPTENSKLCAVDQLMSLVGEMANVEIKAVDPQFHEPPTH